MTGLGYVIILITIVYIVVVVLSSIRQERHKAKYPNHYNRKGGNKP